MLLCVGVSNVASDSVAAVSYSAATCMHVKVCSIEWVVINRFCIMDIGVHSRDLFRTVLVFLFPTTSEPGFISA
jgi:hypothetical protein